MIFVRNCFTSEQLNIVKEISDKTGVSIKLAEIMFSRGIDDVVKAVRYLHPGKHNFNDPFLLSGMKEAVERLKLARDCGERVVVFGDYDADGVCAATIMKRALEDFGVEEVYSVVPERSQGYGLTHELVENVLERYYPDLIITVDCGISCKDEVNFIQDVGVDVIVTDHHEIPEEIPDCVVINCKLKDQAYPCNYLCGAGVAYKVAYALLGDIANKYLDLAALATIADSMILLDENRDIVYEGLKLFKSGGNRALAKLIEKSGLKEITSTGLAFTVAPRINAAGRMGDAHCALALLSEDDSSEIAEKCEILNAYNAERQNLCDLLLRSAKEKLLSGGLHKKCIVLADKDWSGGLVGIVAAKLVEEYNRPVVLFTGNGDKFHGSVRSIDGVNIFQAISACKEHLIDFGGHSQAAGITISEEKIPLFERCFSDYLDANYSAKQFEPRLEVESVIDAPFPIEFAEELDLLEPYGTGNRRPMFCVEAENVKVNSLKHGSPHIVFKTDYIDLIYFNGEKKTNIINAPALKRIAFEANLSAYGGRISLKGYVKAIDYQLENSERLYLECFRKDLFSFKLSNDASCAETIDNETIARLIAGKDKAEKSCLFVASNPETLSDFGIEISNCQLYLPDPRLNDGTVILALEDFSSRDYDAVVYMDKPMFNLAKNNCSARYYISNKPAFDVFGLSADRTIFAEVFKILKLNRFYGESSVDVAMNIERKGIDKKQIIFCLEVFLELGFFEFASGSLQINKSARNELGCSELYRRVSKLLV